MLIKYFSRAKRDQDLGFINQPELLNGGEPTFDDEDFVISATRDSVEFVIGVERNSVDFQVTV